MFRTRTRTRTHALALTAAFALTSLPLPAFAQETESPAPGSTEVPAAEATMTPAGETAAALLEMVPAEIAGMSLTGNSFEASGILASVESDALLQEMADMAAAYDTELNRFAIAGGGGFEGETFISVIGGHLPGVPAEVLEAAFISIVLGPIDPELIAPGEVAGHEVTVIRAAADAGPADTAYLLPVGEVVWLVIGDEASLTAAIEALR